MPCEYRHGAAVRAPGFAESAGLALRGTGVQVQELVEPCLDGEIPGRPYVRPAFGEQQIYFGRPAADALDRGKPGNGFLVVFRQGEEMELKVTVGLRPPLR